MRKAQALYEGDGSINLDRPGAGSNGVNVQQNMPRAEGQMLGTARALNFYTSENLTAGVNRRQDRAMMADTRRLRVCGSLSRVWLSRVKPGMAVALGGLKMLDVDLLETRIAGNHDGSGLLLCRNHAGKKFWRLQESRQMEGIEAA